MPDYTKKYEIERLALLRRLIPDGDGATAVDIGCYDGTISALIAGRGYRVIAVDINPDLVAAARQQHPDLEFMVGSVRDTAGIERALTTCFEVIEHLPPEAQPGFVDELAESIPPGGLLLLSTPGRHSFYSYWERLRKWRTRHKYNWWDPTHVGVMSYRQLRRLLRPAFHIESVVGFYYAPQDRVRPFAIGRRPLSLAGWNLIVTARRR